MEIWKKDSACCVRLLDIRENVRGAIKTTDTDIAKTALLAKGFREAGQTAANAFRFQNAPGNLHLMVKLGHFQYI